MCSQHCEVWLKLSLAIESVSGSFFDCMRNLTDGMSICLQARREAWLNEKTKEIKDVTIKGLEPEINSLVQRHRKEMAELQDRCAADAKRQMDALTGQHDIHVRHTSLLLIVCICCCLVHFALLRMLAASHVHTLKYTHAHKKR
jgi:hypothetical protein